MLDRPLGTRTVCYGTMPRYKIIPIAISPCTLILPPFFYTASSRQIFFNLRLYSCLPRNTLFYQNTWLCLIFAEGMWIDGRQCNLTCMVRCLRPTYSSTYKYLRAFNLSPLVPWGPKSVIAFANKHTVITEFRHTPRPARLTLHGGYIWFMRDIEQNTIRRREYSMHLHLQNLTS
jgi:hypothetical protein